MRWWVLALAAVAAGCNVGPKYQVPAAPAPAAFSEAPPQAFAESDQWKTAKPSDSWTKGKWWEDFQDPDLNALEEQVEGANQSLKSVEARFQQARGLVAEKRSYRLPTVTGGMSITHERYSLNRPAPLPPSETQSGD